MSLAATETICQLQVEPNKTICCLLAHSDQGCFDMLLALTSQGHINWINTTIHHFGVNLIHAVGRAAALGGFQMEWHSRYYLMTLDEPERLASNSDIFDQSTLRIRRLRNEEAEVVDEAWPFRSAYSLTLIRSLIGALMTLTLRYDRARGIMTVF